MAPQSIFITFACVAVQLLAMGSCIEFQVGDREGWTVPLSNQTDFYNHWASHERFKVGDTIRFKYKKDSVMEVKETEYKKCNSTRPNFFSNKGDTTYTLNTSGFFYFISGATGHCQKGQRMIVWVMGQDEEASVVAKSEANKKQFFYGGLLFFHVIMSV